MSSIKASEQIIIFSRYIGQQVVITSLLNDEESLGTLTGIKQNALLVTVDGFNRWIPVTDELRLCDIKLLLKPLKKLTTAIINTANNLPVQAFITPYYQQCGFDMPVFIAPGHPSNCKYLAEIGLADYRSPQEIVKPRRRQLVS